MAISRTTIMASNVLMKRVAERVEKNGEDLTDFYNRAILNQLEKEGDFEIRDLVEEDLRDAKNSNK
jgi:hypothetical protein